MLTQKEEESLKQEIAHIFESGANEVRIFEMVKLFIERRFDRPLGFKWLTPVQQKEIEQRKPSQAVLDVIEKLSKENKQL